MNITLAQALNGFKLANQVRRLSPRTISWYDANLQRFAKWATNTQHVVDLHEVSTTIIRSFFVHLNQEVSAYQHHRLTPQQPRQLSPASTLGYHTSFSAFFNWCMREEFLVKNPMEKLQRPKVPRKIVPTFSQEQIKNMIKACNELPEDTAARTKAIILFLVDTGVRISELTSLKVSELSLEEGKALVMGKGAKQRFVFLGNSTKRALWRYLSLHRPQPLPGKDFVFLTRNKEPLRMHLAQDDLRTIGAKAGVTGVYPHKFRHTAAVQFLRNGGNLFALQKLLGHTTLEMVRRYVELASEDVEKTHRTASPADNWNL